VLRVGWFRILRRDSGCGGWSILGCPGSRESFALQLDVSVDEGHQFGVLENCGVFAGSER
jgi:hypothetical protein